MKKFLMRGSLALASMMLVAVPAFSDTLTFTFTNTATTLASNGNISTYSAVITGITDTSPTLTTIYSYSGLNDTITYNTTSDKFTITTGSNFANGTDDFGQASGTTLLQWVANQSTGGVNSANYGAATSLSTVNASFATTTFGAPTIASISDLGSITVSPSYSNSLSFTATATPEPATFLLFGTGLIGAVLIARRRAAKQIL